MVFPSKVEQLLVVGCHNKLTLMVDTIIKEETIVKVDIVIDMEFLDNIIIVIYMASLLELLEFKQILSPIQFSR